MQVHAYISNHKTFTVECPQCQHTEERSLSHLPSGNRNPFHCLCPCGAGFSVHLVGFRGGARKAVRLAASLARLAEERPVRRFASVLDLSVKGVRVATEYSKNLRVDDRVRVVLVLDDGQRTRLECTATVRRIQKEQEQTTVAMEFQPMSPDDRDVLQAYLSS